MADSLTGLKSLGDGSMGRSASGIFRRGTDVGVGGIGKVGYGELLAAAGFGGLIVLDDCWVMGGVSGGAVGRNRGAFAVCCGDPSSRLVAGTCQASLGAPVLLRASNSS